MGIANSSPDFLSLFKRKSMYESFLPSKETKPFVLSMCNLCIMHLIIALHKAFA
uniref:Uncharacterized protein n=1 Tax=Anguilla anguilla TaxID=7936 RepID=A0A0E9WDI1_ANGAN